MVVKMSTNKLRCILMGGYVSLAFPNVESWLPKDFTFTDVQHVAKI